MGDWFITPLGDRSAWQILTPAAPLQPAEPGQFVCNRCGFPLVPCDRCGAPAICGDAWCQLCQPDG